MATTGQVNTNTTYDSFFWVYWQQEGDQDIANNTTKIYWSCGVTCGHDFKLNAIKMSEVYINGSLVYDGGTYSNLSNGEHLLASGYLDIPHDADGTKTFYISSFTGWLYSNHNYSAAASSHTLTQIHRSASLIGAVDFTDTDNPTITYSNPAGASVTALDACISLTGARDDINYRSITKTGTSYTFLLTNAERDLLRNNTTGTSRKVRFFVRTKIGDTYFYSVMEKTFTITENSNTKPTVSLVTSPYNSGLPGTFNSLYIQGKSKVSISVSGSGKYGATINSRYASMEGKTYSESSTSNVIQGSGTVSVTGYARDSRGFTGSATINITVIDYAKPSVVTISSENAILCYRSDGNGKRVGNSTSLWIKAKRSYHRVSGKNTCALQWRWKEAQSYWNESEHIWVGLLSNTAATDEYNAMVSGAFDTKKAYTVQIRAIDDFGEFDIKTLYIPTEDVALHLGAGGKKVSVGSYCGNEDYTFHSAWKAIFDDEVIVKGKTLAEYIKSVMNGG